MFTLRAKKFENDPDLKTEYYYKGQYKIQNIPNESLELWAKALP